jgi:hypothetical protein
LHQNIADDKSADSAESDLIVNSLGNASSQTRRDTVMSIHFKPNEYGMLTKYKELESIYKMKLSPTIVTLVQEVTDT